MRLFDNYRLIALVIIVFAGVSSGCDKTAPGKTEVGGTVRWEGQPLPAGGIKFVTAEDGLPAGSGQIENGRFKFFSTAGKLRVEILASRPNSNAGTDERIPAYDQYIPERYNAKSELTAEVTLDGKNEFDFSLTEKP
jgi:hypothetical protein